MEFWKTYKIQIILKLRKKENINKKIFSNFKQLNLFLEILKKRNIKIFSIKSDFVLKDLEHGMIRRKQ